jgi:hypothetical protein
MSGEVEEWRSISGYEKYQVSSMGRVRNAATGLVLKLTVDQDGYQLVTVGSCPHRKLVKVHRLVCEAFIGPAAPGQKQVRHLDGSKANNVPANLCWGNPRENYEDAKRHGTDPVGVRNPRAKLTAEQVAKIVDLKGHMKQDHIANLYGVSQTTVSHIQVGRTWTHATNKVLVRQRTYVRRSAMP